MGQAFGLWLIPVISAALGVVSMIVTNHINANVLHTRKSTMDQSAKMTMIIMPLFSLWICFTLPAALGVYWIGNSLFAMLSEFANIPFLRSFLKKQAEDRERRKKEAQERAAQERKAQAEAKKKAAEERRRIQMERKLNKSIATASREGLRTYARGRMYDPDRYPTFPYQDPNKLAKLEEIERQRQEEEKASAKKSKGKKGAKGESSLPESPSPQEETKETSVSTPDQAPAADPSPAEPAAEEVEETFVEESFLEEAEEDQNEKK